MYHLSRMQQEVKLVINFAMGMGFHTCTSPVSVKWIFDDIWLCPVAAKVSICRNIIYSQVLEKNTSNATCDDADY